LSSAAGATRPAVFLLPQVIAPVVFDLNYIVPHNLLNFSLDFQPINQNGK
jgi:hypothetical protein